MLIETPSMEEREIIMAKKANKNKKEQANVEFGQEFGDLNASKLYDTGALTKDKVKSGKRK